MRRHAVQEFTAHMHREPHRYVAGRLPSLPFADASFDLVLSSHLLFSYSDRLGHTFHVDAISELMRVARGELRIFPLVASGSSDCYARFDDLFANLRDRNIAGEVGEVVEVDYRFQGGRQPDVVCRQTTTPGSGAAPA
ncbi:MAG: methyltransferase domain-containing protein [Rhodococcus sp. (in: high G+C Gram-positive bacteria)]|uniref:methyltransferase domain-containing protein n=1 Tax=Rhodococcus sp. TaxID=1831 RepID=UPI003BB05787